MAEDYGREKRMNWKKVCMINENMDVLIEILKRVDGRSMGVAACVCRLWCAISRNDSLWEHMCGFRRPSPQPDGVRAVVTALGGYRRLYMMCVRPVLTRLSKRPAAWTRRRNEVGDLSLSLFCVDYYERVLMLGDTAASSSLSLTFLCKEVNV